MEPDPEEVGSDNAHAYKSCVVWVPRGKASRAPAMTEVAEPIKAERRVTIPVEGIDKVLRDELKMDEYDDEDTMTAVGGLTEKDFETALAHDPYLNDERDSEDEVDEEANIVKPTDFVLYVGSVTRGEDASCETYVYDHESQALYVHHETYLTALPLSADYIQGYRDYDRSTNLIALSTTSPVIEIWDNDQVDSLEPLDYLGKKEEDGGHKDAVVCLRANRITPHALASASADKTVKLWDLHQGKIEQTIEWHTKAVSALRWHPFENSVIATCGEDKVLCVGDVRSVKDVRSTKFESSLEALTWNRHNPFQLLVVAGSGQLVAYDVRRLAEKPLYVMDLSEEDLTDITDTQVNGMVVACGVAGEAYVLDVRGPTPVVKATKELKGGPLYTVAACEDPEVQSLVAFGGSEVIVWDVSESDILTHAFNL